MNRYWIYIIIGDIAEITWVSGLKHSATLNEWGFTILVIFFTGIGTVGTALTGMFFYNEPRDWRRSLFITMIIGSAIGLKLL